jgi:hypothetical protein
MQSGLSALPSLPSPAWRLAGVSLVRLRVCPHGTWEERNALPARARRSFAALLIAFAGGSASPGQPASPRQHTGQGLLYRPAWVPASVVRTTDVYRA